jgi:hypothetical protein
MRLTQAKIDLLIDGILQALPISAGDGTCKIVLPPPKDAGGDDRTKQAVRQANEVAAAGSADILSQSARL